jgi:hypothetical protein
VFLVTAHWPHRAQSEEKRSTVIGLTDFEESSSKKKKDSKKRKEAKVISQVLKELLFFW